MKWSCRCGHISATKHKYLKIFISFSSSHFSFFFSRTKHALFVFFSASISRDLLTPIYRLLSGGVCPKPSIKAPQRKRREERDNGVERESLERENPPFPFTFYTEIGREGVSVSFLCLFLKLQALQSHLYNEKFVQNTKKFLLDEFPFSVGKFAWNVKRACLLCN
uniref:Uncharacterized protein n=1 Tax=Vitis vinifera TaxID=29760 RepID=F6HBF3_VITVI